MFKIIGRILVILLVSGLIAGGLYLIVGHNPSALDVGDRPAGFEGGLRRNFEQINKSSTLPQTPTGSSGRRAHFEGEEHDFDGGLSMGRGFLGITRSLIVFSVITLLVVGIQKVVSHVNRRLPVRVG